MQKHVIIAGTGRAGTTFLVHLLTALGLDTGYSLERLRIDPLSHAGLEGTIHRANRPYIIKSTNSYKHLPQLLDAGEIAVEHAIIPVRNFDLAAKSRVRVSLLGSRRGGLWGTKDPTEQLPVLYRRFAITFETLAKYDIPVTLLWYPRLAQEPEYLYNKLRFLIPGIEFEQFQKTFSGIAKPELIEASATSEVAGRVNSEKQPRPVRSGWLREPGTWPSRVRASLLGLSRGRI